MSGRSLPVRSDHAALLLDMKAVKTNEEDYSLRRQTSRLSSQRGSNMQIFRPDEEGSDHHISNNHKNWSAFDCRNTDPIELGGIPDKIPIFKEYSKENVHDLCVNLAADLFKNWARPSLRQYNPLLPEITKSNANNTKKTICNKIKKVLRENPNISFIPVLEVKKKLIEQWGSLINRNAASNLITPSTLSSSNDPTTNLAITKILNSPSPPMMQISQLNQGLQGYQQQCLHNIGSMNPMVPMQPMSQMVPMMGGMGMMQGMQSMGGSMMQGMVGMQGIQGMRGAMMPSYNPPQQPLGCLGSQPTNLSPISQDAASEKVLQQEQSQPTKEESETSERFSQNQEGEEKGQAVEGSATKTEEIMSQSSQATGVLSANGNTATSVDSTISSQKPLLEEDKSSNGKKRRADGEADGKISTKQAKKPYFFAPVDVPADASEVEKQKINLENYFLRNCAMLAEGNAASLSRIYILQQHLHLEMQLAHIIQSQGAQGPGMMKLPTMYQPPLPGSGDMVFANQGPGQYPPNQGYQYPPNQGLPPASE